MDNRPWRKNRLAVWVSAAVVAAIGAIGPASPASADIFTPADAATVALPTRVTGTGTAGLEIYIAAISQEAAREVTHCSTTVTAAGRYSCAIPAVVQTGPFRFVVYQFPIGQSPTPRNIFEEVAVTVVPSLPVTPADLPMPFVVAGFTLIAGGLGLLLLPSRSARWLRHRKENQVDLDV